MPTLRFEGATLDEAVQVARQSAGAGAKVVGASRVRRGGIAGFFARERIEVEVEVPGKKDVPDERAALGKNGALGNKDVPGRQEAHDRKEPPGKKPATEPVGNPRSAPLAEDSFDPLEHIISQMATEGPSSVLDLAETVNALEDNGTGRSRQRPVFSLRRPTSSADGRLPSDADGRLPPSADEPTTASERDFAAVLERIAHGPEPTADEAQLGPPVHHDPVLLKDLGESQGLGRHLDTSGRPDLGHRRGHMGKALQLLGLPEALCQQVMPAVSCEGLEAELARVLRAALAPSPALPTSPTSVMAVVGPAKHAMATARALASELGTPPEQVVIATQRKVWSRRETVISSPEAAVEQRRSWRWRSWPSVVVVEQPVRPFGTAWCASMLRALEPTLCWGVVEAAHKPEDVATWSAALGGLDVLALVDLEGTTTPASALACSVPVGRLDGVPASAQAWANLLCSRLASH
ncbi:MAG: hypothetical protein ACP5VR_00400 [Acidimicrobiales bacterium]